MSVNAKHSQKGVSIVMVLLVLSIILVIVFAISAQGVWNLNFVNKSRDKKIAFYAAEAAVNEALLRYKNKDTDYTWMQGVASRANPLILSNGGHCYAQVVRAGNPLPNGELVPASMIAFVGTGKLGPFRGTKVDPSTEKQVAVTMNVICIENYAICSAGNVTVKNTDLYGSIRSGGTITQSSSLNVYPEEIRDPATGIVIARGDGRVLCTKFIDNGSKQISIMIDNDPFTIQDVRARGDDGSRPNPQDYSDGITGQVKVSNADPMIPNTSKGVKNDTSIDTAAWVADGSTSPPNPKRGEYGSRLPCPDPKSLIASVPGGNTFRNSTNTQFDCASDGITQLTEGVYYFPDGVKVNCEIRGNVTIITGKSKGQQIQSVNPATGATRTNTEGASLPGVIVYNTNVPKDINGNPIYKVNLIALDGGTGNPNPWDGSGTVGNASISFLNQCNNKGLVYSQGSVTTQGNYSNIGSVISYNGDQTHTGAQSIFTFDRTVCQECPGFDGWYKVNKATFQDYVSSWRRFD